MNALDRNDDASLAEVSAEPILQLIDGFRRSKTLFAAARLGIFDGQRPEGDGVQRLLETCVVLGLLKKQGREYVNTRLADQYLRRSSPQSLCGYIEHSNSVLYPLWAHLENAVLDGGNRWRQTFGAEAAAASRRQLLNGEGFLRGMHGLGLLSSLAVAAAFDLSRYQRLVDLGGATGHLALAVKERYPKIEAIVLDLPPVIELARQHAGDRVQLVAGDFLNDPLPAPDLFALGRILHSRREDEIRKLLTKLHDALPPDGGILIVETLLREDGPAHGYLQSLNMLVCTDGRERTLQEYSRLLFEAGFKKICGKITGVPLYQFPMIRTCRPIGAIRWT